MIYHALDYTHSEDEERLISPDLEGLITEMTSCDIQTGMSNDTGSRKPGVADISSTGLYSLRGHRAAYLTRPGGTYHGYDVVRIYKQVFQTSLVDISNNPGSRKPGEADTSCLGHTHSEDEERLVSPDLEGLITEMTSCDMSNRPTGMSNVNLAQMI